MSGQTSHRTLHRFKPYAAYKDSGVEWLGEIPVGWEVSRLRSTVTGCQNGVWGDEPDGVRAIPCVRVADFDRVTFRVHMADPTLRSIEERFVRTRALLPGDLLLEKSGGGENQPVGAVVLFDHDVLAVCSNFIARIEVANGYYPRFLSYLHAALYAWRINIRHIKQSTGIQNLDSASYLSEAVGLPNEDEQRAIATFLDRKTTRIDALVAKKKRLIELLQEKRTAIITRAVTKGLDPSAPMKDSGVEWLGEIPTHWEVNHLKHAASHVIDCPHETPTYSDASSHFVIRTADVGEGRLDLSGARGVDEFEFHKRIRRLAVAADDVVYSREGERLGFAALVPSGVSACLGQRMMQFRSGVGWFPTFLMWQLNSKFVYQQAQMDIAGATSPHVNVETIRNFWLSEPPLPEQRAIAAFLDRETARIDTLVAKVREAIDRLGEFRTALISAAVTGKIDVREEAL